MDTREKLFNECKYTSMQIFVRVNDFERSIIVDKYIANTSMRDKGKKKKRIKKKNVRLDKFEEN